MSKAMIILCLAVLLAAGCEKSEPATPSEVTTDVNWVKEVLFDDATSTEILDFDDATSTEILDFDDATSNCDALGVWTVMVATSFVMVTETGNEVILDWSGDTVKLTGQEYMDEGAKMFFNYVKNYMDEYIEQKLKQRTKEKPCEK